MFYPGVDFGTRVVTTESLGALAELLDRLLNDRTLSIARAEVSVNIGSEVVTVDLEYNFKSGLWLIRIRNSNPQELNQTEQMVYNTLATYLNNAQWA